MGSHQLPRDADRMEVDAPYYKDYTLDNKSSLMPRNQNNAIRGAITASCFISFFVVIAVINKFMWQEPVEDDSVTEYQLDGQADSKEGEVVNISETLQPFDTIDLIGSETEENVGEDNL